MGNLAAFSELVTEDTILSMPPQPESMRGGKRYANSSATGCQRGRGSTTCCRCARAVYRQLVSIDKECSDFAHEAAAITLISTHHGRIVQLIRFASQSFFPHFGLLDRLPIADA